MELRKRAYCVIASDSALLQEASAVESGDSAPIAGCSGPVPMVWAPRAARGGLARAVDTRRAHQCERSRSRLGAPIQDVLSLSFTTRADSHSSFLLDWRAFHANAVDGVDLMSFKHAAHMEKGLRLTPFLAAKIMKLRCLHVASV